MGVRKRKTAKFKLDSRRVLRKERRNERKKRREGKGEAKLLLREVHPAYPSQQDATDTHLQFDLKEPSVACICN